MDYITKSFDGNFSVELNISEGNSMDNKDAMGKRFAIVIISNGSGMAKLDGRIVPYIAPCVFCINEKEHFVVTETEKNEIMSIYFAPSTINSLLDFDNIRELPDDTITTMHQDIDMVKSFLVRSETYFGKYSMGIISEKRLLNSFFQMKKMLTEQPTNWPCRSRSYLFEMLFFLNNLFETGASSGEIFLEGKDEEFNSILMYMYENYEKKITIKDLTDTFHISKTTLAKLFRDNLNESALTYLNKLRISIAGTLLRDTMLPISEIMLRVSFNDSAHFLRTFKKYVGMSPSAYREKYCWM